MLGANSSNPLRLSENHHPKTQHSITEYLPSIQIAYRMARGADKGMTARRIAIAHDGYEQTLPPADRSLLDALLELRNRSVRPAAPPAEPPRPARLYKATQPPRNGLVQTTHRPAARLEEVKRAPLFREDLADDVSTSQFNSFFYGSLSVSSSVCQSRV